jgi:hypothetical protein
VAEKGLIYLVNDASSPEHDRCLQQLGAAHLPQPPVNVAFCVFVDFSIIRSIFYRKLLGPTVKDKEPLMEGKA